MDTYQPQKESLLRLFADVSEFSKSQGRAVLAEHLRDGAERLEQGKLFVVVAGEFKQGKSSLVDALLDEPDLFPANPDIATCLVSTISYAPREQVTVFVGEDGTAAPRVIQRDQIRDYVMEGRNPKNVQQARLLKIETPNPHLKDGLVLVDTPGTGGLFKRHSEITYAFLPNADAVLYVSDALSPLSVTDLEFLQKIASQCQRIIFVLTKTDLSSQDEYQAVMEGNRAKLAAALNRASEDIRIVPVSSTFKLRYLESRDEDDLEEGNFQTLERELWGVLGESSDILLKRALLVLEQAMMELQAWLDAEREALQHNPQVEELKQRLHAARERMQQLESNKSEWRVQLQRGVRSIERRIRTQFQQELLNVNAKLDIYLDKPDLLRGPDTLLGMVEQDIYMCMTTLDRALNEYIAQLHTQVENATGLGLSSPSVTLVNYTKPVPIAPPGVVQEPKKKLGWWDKLMMGMAGGNREAAGASVLGHVVGAILGLGIDIFTGGATMGGGLIVGGWLGGQIGKIAGYRSGIAHGLEDVRNRELSEVRLKVGQAARRFIDRSRLLCDSTIAEAIELVEQDMTREFVSLIEQERAKGEDLLRMVTEAQRLSQEEARKRLVTMNPALQTAQRLATRLQQITRSVTMPGAGPEDNDGDFANV
jgi:Dynamin family